MKLLLVISILLSGCVTAEYWTVNDHAKLMRQCRALCGKERAQSYSTQDAECVCVGGK